MKRQNQNGFVLIIVIAFIALFGLMMIVLTGISKTMMQESAAANLEATNKNITNSAMAWAKHNAPNLSIGNEPLTVQLDVSDLDISGAACTVTFYKLSNMEIEIKIEIDAISGTGNNNRQVSQCIYSMPPHNAQK